MKHIQEKNDWFYEFRPYLIMGLGVCGLLSRLIFPGGSPHWAMLGFLSSLVLLASGAFIVSMRKEYRKTSTWMK